MSDSVGQSIIMKSSVEIVKIHRELHALFGEAILLVSWKSREKVWCNGFKQDRKCVPHRPRASMKTCVYDLIE